MPRSFRTLPCPSVPLAYAMLLLAGAAVTTTGCANFTAASPAAAASISGGIGGSVVGGRQPIANSTVRIYAAGSTGYGSAATLLATTTTDASGAFNFPQGTYACPSTTAPTSASQTVYITSTGGQPTTGVTNANAVLLAVLGDCSTVVNTQPNVVVNEVTTVAGMFAMQQFFSINASSGAENFGTSATNIIGLQNAAATVNNLVTLSSGFAITSQTLTGSISGYTAPASVTVTPEATKLNTLADILASCVNSSGSSSSTCTTLFSDVSANSVTDTLQAAYYLATNPTSMVNGTSHIQDLYSLASPQSPYQSIVTSTPNDWTLGITYGSTSSQSIGGSSTLTYLLTDPEYLGIDTGGNVWIANYNTNTATVGNSVTELSPTGTPLNQVLTAAGQLVGPKNLILDPSSNVWVTNYGSNSALNSTVAEYSNGTVNIFNTVNAGPGPLVSDGSGNIFVSTVGTYTSTPTANAADIEGIQSGSAPTTATQIATNVTAGQFSGLVVDGNETFYLSNQTSGTLQLVCNQMTMMCPASGQTLSTAGGQSAAEGLALDGNNNVYVGNFKSAAGTGTVSMISSQSPASGAGPFSAGSLAGVQKLLIDGLGNLWVTSYPNNAGTLSEFTPAGAPLSPASTGYAHNFKGALGLAIDRSGNLWVGNFGAAASSSVQGHINEIVGAAAPVVTPLSAELPGAAGNNTRIGQRP